MYVSHRRVEAQQVEASHIAGRDLQMYDGRRSSNYLRALQIVAVYFPR